MSELSPGERRKRLGLIRMKEVGSHKLLFENLDLTPIHPILWKDIYEEAPEGQLSTTPNGTSGPICSDSSSRYPT
jgi:hypothetical protein